MAMKDALRLSCAAARNAQRGLLPRLGRQTRHASTSAETLDGSSGPEHAGSRQESPSVNSTSEAQTSSAHESPKGRVIFSGIQPTGVPHLGNYLGAMRNWVDLQEKADPSDQLFFCVVGLHAITVPQDRARLLKERRDTLAALLAIGLDTKRVTLFHQDQVALHAQLAWCFQCITPMGWLNRMTTWKSKLATARGAASEDEVDTTHLKMGLFSYPVLQAADILLYKTTHVPVGDDQLQHLEFTRSLAKSYNANIAGGDFFPQPQPILSPAKRVLSLRDPTQKMSKSAPDADSRILLTDTDDEIARKYKRAVTDSESRLAYDPKARPGVSNLLSLLSNLNAEGKSPEQWADFFNEKAAQEGQTGSMLKEAVTDATIAVVRPIRQKIEQIQNDSLRLKGIEKNGRIKARKTAINTMASVHRHFGLHKTRDTAN